MKGILLVNTGSPVELSRKAVRSFIGSMLSDPLVLTVPDWVRPLLVKGLILPFRQFASTKRYKQIWDKKNKKSPLLFHMTQLAEKLENEVGMPVEIGMRYEEPSLKRALDKLNERHDDYSEVVVMPLFPHYAESSYETVAEEVRRLHEIGLYKFPVRIIESYFHEPEYISALVDSFSPYEIEAYDKVIFNYHSLPLSHVEKGFEQGIAFDYVYQTKETTRLVVEQLGLNPDKVRQVYSSAMGKSWLKPSLDETVVDLAKKGKTKLLVISPGFAVDNLETLFDIGIQARTEFEANGGEKMDIIPCLNSNELWVNAIKQIIF